MLEKNEMEEEELDSDRLGVGHFFVAYYNGRFHKGGEKKRC